MSEEKTIETDVKQEVVTKDENNVPISRLNEVISERNDLRLKMDSFEKKQEEQKRAKLQEEEKWQELNGELTKELDSYKPYKEKWQNMDTKLLESALARLPESKREKFANVETEVLIDIVEEFNEISEKKQNPPDRQGTVPKEKIGSISSMDHKTRRSNWETILNSYRK